jgi:hypothetical protein
MVAGVLASLAELELELGRERRAAPLLRWTGGSRNSTRVFEFCSGVVDLVVGVSHDGGGGHRFALAGERFVGRLAEDVAEVHSF